VGRTGSSRPYFSHETQAKKVVVWTGFLRPYLIQEEAQSGEVGQWDRFPSDLHTRGGTRAERWWVKDGLVPLENLPHKRTQSEGVVR
jgi:hypothetical protein